MSEAAGSLLIPSRECMREDCLDQKKLCAAPRRIGGLALRCGMRSASLEDRAEPTWSLICCSPRRSAHLHCRRLLFSATVYALFAYLATLLHSTPFILPPWMCPSLPSPFGLLNALFGCGCLFFFLWEYGRSFSARPNVNRFNVFLERMRKINRLLMHDSLVAVLCPRLSQLATGGGDGAGGTCGPTAA